MPSGTILVTNPSRLVTGYSAGGLYFHGTYQTSKLTGVTPVATGFYKDLEGTVWLKGLIKSGAVGATAFTLPAGYRPLEDLPFDVHAEGASTSVLGAVVVKSTGDVVVSIGDNALVSLSGISFRGEH